eukprot:9328629-Pyramimonas_sp.AAC.1
MCQYEAAGTQEKRTPRKSARRFHKHSGEGDALAVIVSSPGSAEAVRRRCACSGGSASGLADPKSPRGNMAMQRKL